MAKKMPLHNPSSGTTENDPSQSNDDLQLSSPAADSEVIAVPENEAGDMSVVPQEVSVQAGGYAELSSTEELSSQDTIDENHCELREGSMSPDYPSEHIQYNLGPANGQRDNSVNMQSAILQPLPVARAVHHPMPRQLQPYVYLDDDDDDDDCDLYETIRIPEVDQPEERRVSRKRRAEDNAYFEFDWDDELRAEGHLPPLSQPDSCDDAGSVDTRSQLLIGSESPMNLRYIREMGMSGGVIADPPASPHSFSNFDVTREQREAAEMFATKLQQRLKEVPQNRCMEKVTNDGGDRPTVDMAPPAHRESTCCADLIKKNTLGWDLDLPTINEDIRTRTRPELLRLLHDVTSLLCEIKYDDIKNEEELKRQYLFLRRLARKLKYRLSTFNSVFSPICSCTKVSESCVGVVTEGLTKSEHIYCKFTGRRIPVAILKTNGLPAPWIKMKKELFEKVKVKRLCELNSSTEDNSLTYAHITAESLPAVKCLLENYFWSNIDVSTILQYPEFSCAVFYGKLVVGLGYLTPGGHRNEGYINFLFVRPHWRRCGIGGFILYLLRQQCLYWTLTLHVSPKSEALNLYHKFGFKICSRIKNFYADYVISNSQGDKDALFMKLESKLPQVY